MPSVTSFFRRRPKANLAEESSSTVSSGSGETKCQDDDKDQEINKSDIQTPIEEQSKANEESINESYGQVSSADAVREILLKNLKKEVKQIMELAVTKKVIHEDCANVVTFAAAVENCLFHGLKKRSLGLFRESSTLALLNRIAKECPEAQAVLSKMSLYEAASASNSPPSNTGSPSSIAGFLFRDNSFKSQSSGNGQGQLKNLWIRIALFEKQLVKIADYVVNHGVKFYCENSIIADPCDGPLFASLLAGPCALEYSHVRAVETSLWKDPNADELIQRHRIHGGSVSQGHQLPYVTKGNSVCNAPSYMSPKKPSLRILRPISGITSNNSESEGASRNGPPSAKEYVESLHQNHKSTLLYGKNNVLCEPVSETGIWNDDVEKMPGYLSLHHYPTEGLTIKWTPNQLMNGTAHEAHAGDHNDIVPQDDCASNSSNGSHPKSIQWDFASTIYVRDIVYLHCHQQLGHGGTIVPVGQDGVQRPPLHFPAGGHLLAFLSCLETGLLPKGMLDPPLWSQKGKGETFPRLQRRSTIRRNPRNQTVRPRVQSYDLQNEDALQEVSDSALNSKELQNASTSPALNTPYTRKTDEGEHQAECTDSVDGDGAFKNDGLEEDEFEDVTDFVFRIVYSDQPFMSIDSGYDPETPGSTQFPWHPQYTMAALQERCSGDDQVVNRNSIKQLCDTMKKQIISRAFYGWLAYCRHLKAVRHHLSDLVLPQTLPSISDCSEYKKGLTVERWREITSSDTGIKNSDEIYRLVYFGGCAASIRNEVWPYILGLYDWEMTKTQKEELDQQIHSRYEQLMSEWLAAEAIVRQREQENLGGQLNWQDSCRSISGTPLVPSGEAPQSAANGHATDPELLMESLGENDVFEEGGSENAEKESANCPDEGIHEDQLSELSDSQTISIAKPVLKPVTIKTALCNSPRLHNPSVDSGHVSEATSGGLVTSQNSTNSLEVTKTNLHKVSEGMSNSCDSLESTASPASYGGYYPSALLEQVSINLHRIDKDVTRCDRNYYYFSSTLSEPGVGEMHLATLRNIMVTYVWEHLDLGYVQGMCDIVAPLLVILEDEAITHACFTRLMLQLSLMNPQGGIMDAYFANMRSLIQILDPEIFEHMLKNGDFTHFYFCYRWFLLDFKREFCYDDVFKVWESIWCAKHVATPHPGLFIALAMMELYRDIILENNMDFTDIIKFFNEMAEKHDVNQVLGLSHDLVYQLQSLISEIS